jgi:serine/threonine-protein kinase HipA
LTGDRVDQLVVVLDAPDLGPTRPVGTLTRWTGSGRRAVSFAYADEWLRWTGAFPIDPRTLLLTGDQHYGADTLPPALADTTPDAWGRRLLTRAARRGLSDWELLVAISDETRMGALRLGATASGPFLADQLPTVPPMASLRELQDLARRFEEDPDADIAGDRLRDLVVPGSSLGGARPKANVRDADGSLWIAKFPSPEDRRLDIGAWEYVYARLAQGAGIEVPEHRMLALYGRGRGRTFLVRRFDRDAAGDRRLYVSAMTLTDHRDGEPASYPDIAQAISRYGAAGAVGRDLAQLFRRLVFNVVAGNRDDHLRNHGFLRTPAGWRLAPAFDMNPAREAHPHSLSLDGRTHVQDLATVLATHRLYALNEREARGIIGEVVVAVERWRQEAIAAGIGEAEQDIVSAAFGALEEASGMSLPAE